jgi:hypothetical protein
VKRLANFNLGAGLKRAHMTLTLAWGAMLPIAYLTGWLKSVVFVSLISIYANFVGHFSAWQASRAEVEAQD